VITRGDAPVSPQGHRRYKAPIFRVEPTEINHDAVFFFDGQHVI
jgi:hypothetical protein